MCVHTEALKQIIVAEVPFKTCSLWIFFPSTFASQGYKWLPKAGENHY